MPQIANLILTDRAAVPVNHTFTPRDAAGGKGVLVSNTGVTVGEKRFTIASSVNSNGKTVVRGKLILPVVATETINGVSMPKVVRTAYANFDLSFDATSTEQERKDAVGMIASSLDAAKWVNDVTTKNETVY